MSSTAENIDPVLDVVERTWGFASLLPLQRQAIDGSYRDSIGEPARRKADLQLDWRSLRQRGIARGAGGEGEERWEKQHQAHRISRGSCPGRCTAKRGGAEEGLRLRDDARAATMHNPRRSHRRSR